MEKCSCATCIIRIISLTISRGHSAPWIRSSSHRITTGFRPFGLFKCRLPPCLHNELIFKDRRTAGGCTVGLRQLRAAINNANGGITLAPAERFLTRDYQASESSARCVALFWQRSLNFTIHIAFTEAFPVQATRTYCLLVTLLPVHHS